MPRVLWTPIAESDLDGILYYLSRVARSPKTGERIFLELTSRVVEQASKPHTGHLHAAAPAGWRYFKHKRWLVFYQAIPNGIEVMRVIDAVRDLPRQLRDT